MVIYKKCILSLTTGTTHIRNDAESIQTFYRKKQQIFSHAVLRPIPKMSFFRAIKKVRAISHVLVTK